MSSRRMSKRLARQWRSQARATPINIVSLIDIFAILVFYLLVNALVVEILPSTRALLLPESAIEEQPRETTVILVTPEEILVDKKPVMATADARATDARILSELKFELLGEKLLPVEGQRGRLTRGEVNIMADKAIPYSVLKKVMATCTEAQYAKISLAVLEKAEGRP